MNKKYRNKNTAMRHSNTPINLKQRNDLAFDFINVPALWLNNKVVASHYMNAASLIAPPSERYFVEVMRQAKALIPDKYEKLQQDMTGFIQQEGMHARVHHQFNQHLASLGYDIQPINRMYERMFNSFRDYPIRKQLAILAAGEHFTYVAGKMALESPLLDSATPEVRRMWRWHALEEIEHKSVAYDVCKLQGTGYFERMWGFYKIQRTYGQYISKASRMLLMQEKNIGLASVNDLTQAAIQTFIWPGYFPKTMLEVQKYLHPKFKVWKRAKIKGDLDLLAYTEREIYAGNSTS